MNKSINEIKIPENLLYLMLYQVYKQQCHTKDTQCCQGSGGYSSVDTDAETPILSLFFENIK